MRDETSKVVAQQGLKLAYVLMEQGDKEAAIEACDAAIEAAPGHPTPAAVKGALLMGAGALEEAWQWLSKARRVHAGSALVEVYFAEVCFMMGRASQGKRALKKARRAPDVGAYQGMVDALEEFWCRDSA